uniref:Uncharacterized protein n=1 Tax=Brassica campestris TaxID=3711 RepID=A0A3P6C9I1_BRACM|nr:unnamed protein product [Brassica rapa]
MGARFTSLGLAIRTQARGIGICGGSSSVPPLLRAQDSASSSRMVSSSSATTTALHGYSNFSQSQTEMSLERQQQNPRDGAGAQVGQPSDQTHQLWQNSY